MEKIKINRTLSTVQIVSALTFAAVMVACSFVLKGTEGYGLISNILIAGATTQFLLLSSVSAQILAEFKKAINQGN